MLLVVWLVPGLSGWEAIFGMAHGLGWIAMSLACLAALRLRVIDLRLAVAVAVLGGIGPFIGSYEFWRQSRAGAAASPAAGEPAPTGASIHRSLDESLSWPCPRLDRREAVD